MVAWAFSWRLDEELAGGADPDRDALLARRARQLTSDAFRHKLAADLGEVVIRSAQPRRFSGATNAARANVRAQRARLEQVMSLLNGNSPVGVRGIAAATLLVTDVGSPLWASGSAEDLGERIDAVLDGLGR